MRRRDRSQLGDDIVGIVRRMLHVDAQPIETRMGERFGHIGTGERKPEPDRRLALFQTLLEWIRECAHRVASGGSTCDSGAERRALGAGMADMSRSRVSRPAASLHEAGPRPIIRRQRPIGCRRRSSAWVQTRRSNRARSKERPTRPLGRHRMPLFDEKKARNGTADARCRPRARRRPSSSAFRRGGRGATGD